MRNPQTSNTVDGIVIAVLVFLLSVSGIAVYWEAQIIARQAAVIHMLEHPYERLKSGQNIR
jgi:cadmium resistance protein CadD (predicted permease)